MCASKKSKKINARITPFSDKILREMARASESNISQVIMDALASYYVRGMGKGTSKPYEIALQSGIIGCASGPGDLSETYKKEISKRVAKKI